MRSLSVPGHPGRTISLPDSRSATAVARTLAALSATATREAPALLRGSVSPRSRGGVAGWLDNVRAGRMQKTLAVATALSAPPLAFEIYLEHYKGSFGDKWMWTPIVLTPALTAAGIAGLVSERAARTWLPAVSVLYALDGLVGTVTHLQGVRKKPGGFSEPKYNLVMGPPLLAPGSLCMVGALGVLAALLERER